jgi:hypothetical protein
MKILECSRCGMECKVSNEATAITCWHCVNELITESLPKTSKKNVGYPKGWRFMNEFVHADGTVYHKGVEQPELKGKLKPTEIAIKPKLSKKQKEEQKLSLIEEYALLKKKLKAEKRKSVRKKIELRLSKISKLI